MAKKEKRPIITEKELCVQVSEMTGVPLQTVMDVIGNFNDSIEFAIRYGVEVKCRLGTFSWMVKKEKKGYVFKYGGIAYPPKDIPEHNIPTFRVAKAWKTRLKEFTRKDIKNEDREEMEEDGDMVD